ncbi:MAG: bifunctional riboflavin kinase/FAD synthetase [Clostridiales bacterium]|nr:bifunctional riboflavin kinase/FAD synthetase [Clostridiales bacterium]
MRVFRSIEEIRDIEPTSIALGYFDGLHKGHMVLIDRAVADAAAQGRKSAVFTFFNSPKNMIPGKAPVKRIISWEEKLDLLERAGVEYLFAPDFTEDFKHMSADEFARKLLGETCRMKAAFCGFNYHFGHKAQGTPAMLKEIAKEEGMEVYVQDALYVGDELVSSTLVRKAITEGRVDLCREYMDRNFGLSGTVAPGKQLGRTIGFPTCNFMPAEEMILPADGVYATLCIWKNHAYPAITNVGLRPTVSGVGRSIETNLLGFEGDLYGETIRVEFLNRIRPEVKFDSLEALQEQIQKDIRTAMQFYPRLVLER